MASIVRDPNGRKRILYFNADGERKPLRLGIATMGYAREVATNVDLLIAAKRNGATPDPKIIDWLTRIGDDLHKRHAEHGVVAPRTKAGRATLAAFVDGYIAGRTDMQPNTLRNLKNSRRRLVDHFGADKAIGEISPGDAEVGGKHW